MSQDLETLKLAPNFHTARTFLSARLFLHTYMETITLLKISYCPYFRQPGSLSLSIYLETMTLRQNKKKQKKKKKTMLPVISSAKLYSL
jgi:hypothetical protein